MSTSAHHNALSMDREFRYILQWFGEWSEIQREDFVPVLLECLDCSDSGAVLSAPLVNGVLAAGMAGASLADNAGKPMSLFQCRVKLFREWSAKWPTDLKQKLREKCQQIDAEWSDRFASELAAIGTANGFAADGVSEAALPMPVDAVRSNMANGVDEHDIAAIVHVGEELAINLNSNNGSNNVAAAVVQLAPTMNLQNGAVSA